MTGVIPGAVLIVDDAPEEVRDLLTAFMDAGQPVLYLDRASKIKPTPGIRLVVLDLDLDGDKLVTDGDIEQGALVLSRLAAQGCRFCLVTIWSKQLSQDDSQTGQDFINDLRRAYRDQTGLTFPLEFFLTPLSKSAVTPQDLVERVTTWAQTSPHAGLVLEWERLVEQAKDQAASDVMDIQGGSLSCVIQTLKQEMNEAAGRELIALLNRVLLRSTTASDLTAIHQLIASVRPSNIDIDWYARFHYFQTYYVPDISEPLWTGDIVSLDEQDPLLKHAVVITPRCDLAQRKANTMIKVAYALQVEQTAEGPKQIFEVIYPDKQWHNASALSSSAIGFLEAVCGLSDGLPDRYYPLRFVKSDDQYKHFIVDLHNVRSLKLQEVESSWKAKRLCRVDVTQIDHLLQHYAGLSGRPGIPTIPREVRKADAQRLKSLATTNNA